MADLAELFPGLVDAVPPREGYASNPIGRDRQARPKRRRTRAPNPVPEMRRQIDDGFTSVRQSQKCIEATLPALSNCSVSSVKQSSTCGGG